MQAPEFQAARVQAANTGASAPAQTSPDPATEADLRLQRTMKFVVGGLALLLVAGLVVVAMRVIYLASKPRIQAEPQATTEAPAAAAPTLALRPELSLALPAGAEVRSISLSGNRLAVHYVAAARAGIAVLDLKSGRKLTDVTIVPATGSD